jgi:hypothetical protein
VTPEEAEPKESPLGRYDADAHDGLHEVHLVNVPLRVLAASREQHDEVMREFAMIALDENFDSAHTPTRFIELIDILGRRYGAASARPDAEVDAALARGDATIDLIYHVPEHVTEAAQQLDVLMSEADEFCRQQHMLTLARPQLLIDFARWYLDEFTRQVAGEKPRPWDGPLDLQSA